MCQSGHVCEGGSLPRGRQVDPYKLTWKDSGELVMRDKLRQLGLVRTDIFNHSCRQGRIYHFKTGVAGATPAKRLR